MATVAGFLRRHIPVLDWARAYAPGWLKADVLAGLASSAVVIPKAMAYATIAGLPVAVGLYTVLIPGLVYAVFGASRILSVSTTTTLAILTGTQLALVSAGSSGGVAAVATLSVMTGIVLLLAFVLRLGFLANFVSEPVLIGFKTGIGIVIIIDQLPKLLGIHIQKASLLHKLLQTISLLPQLSVPATLLGCATLALIFVLERYAKQIPVPLIAVALGIIAVVLGLPVETIGAIEHGLPRVTLPDWSLAETMWPGALGLALISFTESIAAMRAFAATSESRSAPDQELFALGMVNLATGFMGGMPAGGGTTQTAVNRSVGARTQISGVVTAAMALAALLLLGPAIARIPQATLAAIVIAYSVELIRVSEFRAVRRIRTTEFWWAIIACAGIIVFGTLQGILVAVLASLASLAQQVNNPPVYAVCRKRDTDEYGPLAPLSGDDEVFPGLLIVRVEGRLFFGNLERVADKVHRLIDEYHPRVLILDCRALFDLEYSGLRMLTQAEATLRAHGITLWIVAPNPGVLQMLEHAPLGKALGPGRIFHRLHPAVEAYRAQN